MYGRASGVSKTPGHGRGLRPTGRESSPAADDRVVWSALTDTLRDCLAAHRQQYLDAVRADNADGKPARTWPIQFLVRRTAHHVLDHAWEVEDRDVSR